MSICLLFPSIRYFCVFFFPQHPTLSLFSSRLKEIIIETQISNQIMPSKCKNFLPFIPWDSHCAISVHYSEVGLYWVSQPLRHLLTIHFGCSGSPAGSKRQERGSSEMEGRTRSLQSVLQEYNKFYHHIIKYTFLTFLRCHFTEAKEWDAVLPTT